MTERERAILKDRVARKRLARERVLKLDEARPTSTCAKRTWNDFPGFERKELTHG